MKVLIDTNILIDYAAKREHFYEDAKTIIQLCLYRIAGCVSPHSLLDMAYVLYADYKFSLDKIRNIIQKFATVFEVAEENRVTVLRAVRNLDFNDIEDSVQNECALSLDVDCIVTRNKKDFAFSKRTVLTPEEFIDLFN